MSNKDNKDNKDFFESIKEGLKDAIDYFEGKRKKSKTTKVKVKKK